jgi:hypothetical protein
MTLKDISGCWTKIGTIEVKVDVRKRTFVSTFAQSSLLKSLET